MNNKLVYGANSKQPSQSNETFKRKYGLKKIEDKLNKSSTEYSILNQGIDLTTFGLNLNSADDIIDTFGSPFDVDSFIPFQCSLPRCYTKKVNQVADTKILPKLQDKTLIYIFYNIPDKKMKLEAVKLL